MTSKVEKAFAAYCALDDQPWYGHERIADWRNENAELRARSKRLRAGLTMSERDELHALVEDRVAAKMPD